MHQPFPSLLQTTEPPHLHIVSRAHRETTKSKYMHPQFSATTRLALRGSDEVLYFRSKVVLGLPVSTISYFRHAVSTVQTRSTGPDNEWSLTDTDRAKHSLPGLQFSIHLILNIITHIIRHKDILYLASNRKLLDFYRDLLSIAVLPTYTY